MNFIVVMGKINHFDGMRPLPWKGRNKIPEMICFWGIAASKRGDLKLRDVAVESEGV